MASMVVTSCAWSQTLLKVADPKAKRIGVRQGQSRRDQGWQRNQNQEPGRHPDQYYPHDPNPQFVTNWALSDERISASGNFREDVFASGPSRYSLAHRQMFKMRWSQVQYGAIWIVQGKTKAKLRIDVVGELATLFERIKARGLVGMTILADPKGQALKAFGYFRSHFDKARDAAKVEADALGVPFIRFQLRNLRAKAASDLESMSHARKLLGYTTENMTREYIRTRVGERVSPVMAKSFSPLPEK